MKLSKKHFQIIDNENEARRLFKENVEAVEIGISSYCNRVCKYCPNSFIDRRNEDRQMSDELFNSILNQLKEVDYENVITLHRYNEPFANYEYAIRRIKQIKALLPNAKIQISSNGDYLDRNKLSELSEILGTSDSIHVTLHFPPSQTIASFQKMKEDLREKVSKLG